MNCVNVKDPCLGTSFPKAFRKKTSNQDKSTGPAVVFIGDPDEKDTHIITSAEKTEVLIESSNREYEPRGDPRTASCRDPRWERCRSMLSQLNLCL